MLVNVKMFIVTWRTLVQTRHQSGNYIMVEGDVYIDANAYLDNAEQCLRSQFKDKIVFKQFVENNKCVYRAFIYDTPIHVGTIFEG